jgi:hypothetical protein
VRIVTGREIVVAPASGERPAALPARRPSGIAVSRAPRPADSAPARRGAQDFRGRIVDILV